MYLRTNPDGSLASYVENYGTDKTLSASNGVPRFFDVPNGDVLQDNILEVVKTRNPNGLVATVVMEFVAPDDDPTGKKRTTFYVYGADGNRVGIAGLNLDGRGSKANPGVCLVCHGGKPQALVNGVYPNKGDTGAYFLPWDVGTFIFDAESGFTKADQEKNFRELNRAVASHHEQRAQFDPVSGLNRRIAPVELIRGWYGGAALPNDTFDESFVPVGWRPSVERGIPVGARKVYREVIGPTCRACHAQRESALDFATFKGFDVHRASVVNLTYTVPHALVNGAVDDSPARPGDDRAVMPLALRTYENFWNSTAPAQLRNFINSLPAR
jgi:mono/diheme cytochrome c family protein